MRERRSLFKLSLVGVALAGLVLISWSTPRKDPAARPSAGEARQPVDPALFYEPAAKALRSGNCPLASKHLADAAGDSFDPALHSLVEGLYAHACEDIEGAEKALFLAARDQPGSPTVLEDWRLFILAETASALGHPVIARASLARLLGNFPVSPLRPQALLLAAEIEWRGGDATQALAVIERARRELEPGEALGRLEALAWEIGSALVDPAVRAKAARGLLVDAPLEADRLQVAESYRSDDGTFDWRSLLDAEDLRRRTRNLLDLDRLAEASEAAKAVAAHERDLEWHLLATEILTRDHRGREALRLLDSLAADNAADAARLTWARANAAADSAVARRGRTNPPSEKRREFRRASIRYLEALSRSIGDSDLVRRSLRRLFEEYTSDDRFEEALAVLVRLRRMDPTDTIGSAHLWNLGWKDYRRRNYTGAVGIWTELADLYPESRYARSGRYWTGRAFEALGQESRARSIYRSVADSDTTDFYRKYALSRLGEDLAPAPASFGEPRGWPSDPKLERARLLSDLGLDDLARSESEAFAEESDPVALNALRSLIEARQGDRRASISLIRRAFPVLGGSHQGTVPRAALELYYPVDYEETIRTLAAQGELDPALVFAMIRQESGFDRTARSVAGAQGLMQLMPATGREVAGRIGLRFSRDRLTDPGFNVRLGTTYFRQVLDMFDGNVELALAGYNGGPYRLKRLWGKAPRREGLDTFLESLQIRESKIYVKRILLLSDSYHRLYEDT